MGLAGQALVAIWNDIRPDMREDFMEWHPREHMVERLGIPGFLRGRRCIALDGGVEFLTLYELRDGEVLTSPHYLERLTHPTPWSARTLPAFTNNTRGACRIAYTDGHAMGAFVLTLRFEAQPGSEESLSRALTQRVMPEFVGRPRITGAHFVKNDPSLTAGNSGNQRGRVIHLPSWIVLVEGASADGVRAAGEALLGDARLEALGARAGVERNLFQLEYSIQNLGG